MKSNSTSKALCIAALLGSSMAAQAALEARDVDRNTVVDAFYDTELDITWLADFKYSRTSRYDDDGLMNLSEARTWADSLDYFGVTQWRLPNVTPVGGGADYNYAYSTNGSTDNGFSTTGRGWGGASEMGHLYYVSLGNAPYTGYSAAMGGSLNTGPFRNVERFAYWSGPDYGRPVQSSDGTNQLTIQNPGWDFDLWDGSQDYGDPKNRIFSVAVANGDVFVSAVPEPGTYAMLLAGLALVVPIARRRAAARAG